MLAAPGDGGTEVPATIGLRRHTVRVVAHRREWHVLFESERRALLERVGHLVLDASEERVRELKTDRDALLAPYAEAVPGALDRLTGEERMRVYEMLQLEVRPDTEGYEVSGAFCSKRSRSTDRSDSINPIELRFCALVTEGEARVRFYREGFGRLKEILV